MKEIKNPKETLRQLKKDLIVDVEDESEINKEEHAQIDHFHGQHHFDRHGNHDDITEDEFKLSALLKVSSRSVIYRLVLTGVFLALAIAASAIDMLTESAAIPIGQVYIQTRFLDTIIMLLALPAIGPLYAIILGMIEPILHNLMHGMEHGWIQPLMDMFTNSMIIFLTWIIFYYLFKNSPYHKDPNRKVDLFKRITPSIILALFSSLISTLTFILALKIQDITSNINLLPKESEINFSNISNQFAIMFFGMFGINILRYIIAFGIYIILEGKTRSINHRYK